MPIEEKILIGALVVLILAFIWAAVVLVRFYRTQHFIVCRKPLARRVVPKKACADDEDRKTPFVVK